ncbi:MAG TPA: DUF1501 domain-containing protein [Pirellulales bacterium]|jgi:hypothetical protein|nr:DUF1501 domain-containing protein [Pirellulales bacterium]
MSNPRFCDGFRRRDVLKVGVLGGLGLNLVDYLRMAKAATVGSDPAANDGTGNKPKAKAAIYIRLGGGPTHMDTFDLKPEAPAEYRGQLKPIKTNVAGMEISEQMPLLAKCADKFTILRGVSHTLAAHELGSKYLLTGNRPLPSLEFPAIGSVVAKELQSPDDLPPYVAIPNSYQGPGYLGLPYGAFSTNTTPRMGQKFSVRGISLQEGMTIDQVSRREKLLASVDTTFRKIEERSDVLAGLDEFSEQAYAMISSSRARQAFDIGKEPESIVQRFGDGETNQGALLACRLIEAGARFVTIQTGKWDMHEGIYTRLEKEIPALDRSLSALLTTLEERGLLETTAIMVSGEFGRTPKINQRGGRDHWPRAMFCLMAGGGMKTGQVIGSSDELGQGPAGDAIAPDDVAYSLFHALGINPHKEYHTNTGRPVMISREGKLIEPLFA